MTPKVKRLAKAFARWDKANREERAASEAIKTELACKWFGSESGSCTNGERYVKVAIEIPMYGAAYPLAVPIPKTWQRTADAGVHDRINTRGLLVVGNPMTATRMLRQLRKTVESRCRWCGSQLPEYQPFEARFCNAECRKDYYS